MFLQADAGTGIIGLLMPFIIMGVVFYFVLLRPQQNQQKKRQEMLNSLKLGDKIISVGGIYGEITALNDEDVTLKIAEQVEIQLSRAGIGSIRQ